MPTVSLPESSGWYGGTARLDVPQDVKDFFQAATEVSDALSGFVSVTRTAAEVLGSAIPLYSDPLAAGIEAVSAAIGALLEGTSLGSVKVLVVSDVPDISTALARQQAVRPAAAAKEAETVARAAFQSAANSLLGSSGPFQGNGILRTQQNLAANLNASVAGTSQPAVLAIREKLLASLTDLNDLNVPGANSGSTAIGLSLVTYGDAAGIDALVSLVGLVRQLLEGFKSQPATPQGLTAPTNVKVRNLSRARGANRVQITWDDNLPKTFPLDVDGKTWYPPRLYVERSFDGITWTTLSETLTDGLFNYDEAAPTWTKKLIEYKAKNLYIDSALAVAINARADASLPVGTVKYRLKYHYLGPNFEALDVYSPIAFYTPGSKSTGPSVPPDWISLEYAPDYSIVMDALDQLRGQVDAQASQIKRALERLYAFIQKWIAKIQVAVDKIANFIRQVSALLTGLSSAAIAGRYFNLTGIEYDLNAMPAPTVANISNLGVVNQSPLTARIYQEYSDSLQKLNAAISPSPAAGSFDCGLGVFFVVESQAAGIIIETIAKLLGLYDVIAAGTGQLGSQLAAVGEQYRTLWEDAASAVTPLPPTDQPLPAPDPSVSLGERDSPLNINPAPGTYEKPLLGETDYPGADLNCPT